MPIVKVPVIHKFGIISQSQRQDLQQRLLQQTYDEGNSGILRQPSHSNPLEVSEQFVQKFNRAVLKDKEILQEKANMMLQRSKRRCGLASNGDGHHVDLPLAWSELAVLAQCKGKLQEDCFNILCLSLDHAPLQEENIPTLFFLAESSLYWLRTDALKQPHLRSSEVKLLKMGQLVFARLLYHHLSGHLRGLADFKSRLHVYLDGVKDQQGLYKSYPGIWLALRFVSRVGEIVVGPYANAKKDAERVAESVPGLAACVYRSLCVWRCASTTKIGIKKAILAMLLASHELRDPDWINGFISVSLLGEAAKVNLTVCKSLQDLARGVQVAVTSEGLVQTEIDHFPSGNLRTGQTARSAPTGTTDQQQQQEGNTRNRTDDRFQAEIDGLVSDINSVMKSQTDSEEPGKATLGKAQSSSQATRQPTVSTAGSQPRSKLGTGNLDQVRQNELQSGIGSWCWETVYQYSQILADTCLNGSSSNIQKMALLGKWQDADVTTFRAGAANPCVESCGLVDLLEYRGPQPGLDLDLHMRNYEWTWVVRYGALSGLARLIHTLHGNAERDGMRSAAWSLVMALQESPTSEDRVLEALRVGQVEVPPGEKAAKRVSVWTRIAKALSDVYLVPLPQTPKAKSSPDPSGTSPRRNARYHPAPSRAEPRTTPSPTGKTSPRKSNVTRPTIREDITIHTTVGLSAPDFKTRTSLDLTRVVADQWRKEMIRNQKEEEDEMLKQLEEKRNEDEKREEDMIIKRQEKLRGRPTIKLAPYQVLPSST